MKPEIRTFAPGRILEKAQQLKANGLYAAALELLERNSIQFAFYDYFIEQRTPVPKRKRGGFKKKGLTRTASPAGKAI